MNEPTISPISFPSGCAVVIGGSGGIGAAIAKSLANAGSDVAISYRNNRDAAEGVQAQIRASGVTCSIHQLDTADTGKVQAVIAEIADAQPIHSLINAAGASIPMEWISKIEPETWSAVMKSDIDGVFNVVQAVLPHLRKARGAFVQISSAGLRRYPTRDVLSVAPKAAIEALVQGIAREEGRFGVRANSIGVGVVEAGMFLRLKGSHFNEEWIEAAKNNAALKRFGSAEEVANVAVFLASNQSSYVTGQFIAVDGGYTV